MRIYVSCDLEGVGGVVDHRKQCWLDGSHLEQARRLATLELNALVEGAVEGGATEVVAWEGHCRFPGIIDIESLHPACQVIVGLDGSPAGLHSSYDALFLFGLHAMAGTPGAVLAHSFMSSIESFHLNGVKMGEIGLTAVHAGTLGIPTVFVSGDAAACREAVQLIPSIECAPVKETVGNEVAGLKTVWTKCLSNRRSCNIIRAAAKRAVEKCRVVEPLKFQSPFTVRVRYTDAKCIDEVIQRTGATRMDERTIEMTRSRPEEIDF